MALHKVLAEYANNKLFSDVRFIVGKNQQNKEIFHGHKLVLAARSPVFKTMFTNDTAGIFTISSDDVIIDDAEPHEFKFFLKCMYSDIWETKVLDLQLVLATLYIARKYMVTHLINHCETYLIEQLKPDNVLLIGHPMFSGLENSTLRTLCINIKISKTAEILKCEQFLEIDEQTMFDFLGLDLQIKETALFESLLFWANAQLKKLGIFSPNSTNLRQILGTTLYQIRFPLMSNEEFSKVVVSKNILTDEETLSVYKVIGKIGVVSKFIAKQRSPLERKGGLVKIKIANKCCSGCGLQILQQPKSNFKLLRQIIPNRACNLRVGYCFQTGATYCLLCSRKDKDSDSSCDVHNYYCIQHDIFYDTIDE